MLGFVTIHTSFSKWSLSILTFTLKGNGDDSATNCVRLYCRGEADPSVGDCTTWYGEWDTTASCPGDQDRICGYQTRTEASDAEDGTALNDVKFLCCNGY